MLWEESWLRHSTPVQSMKSTRSTCPRGTCTGAAGAAGAGAAGAAPAAAVLAAAMGWFGSARLPEASGRARGGEGEGEGGAERGERVQEVLSALRARVREGGGFSGPDS